MTRGLNNIYKHLENSQTLNGTYWYYQRLLSQDNSSSYSSRSSSRSSSVSDVFLMDFRPQSVMDCDKVVNYCHKSHNNLVKKHKDMMLQNDEMVERVEVIMIMAPLMENPNAPDENGRTPLYWAAQKGYIEIVKILAPFSDNPNAADEDGKTPIFEAANRGHTAIVKFLVPLTSNANTPDKDGCTPIHCAACNGHNIQKLSKSWCLWQITQMLQMKMEELQFIVQH